jgi:hypothetical protein
MHFALGAAAKQKKKQKSSLCKTICKFMFWNVPSGSCSLSLSEESVIVWINICCKLLMPLAINIKA